MYTALNTKYQRKNSTRFVVENVDRQTDRQTLTPHYALMLLNLGKRRVHNEARRKTNFHKFWNQKQAIFTYKKKSEELVVGYEMIHQIKSGFINWFVEPYLQQCT
jgi:hypothetical protein